ncbi:hypothetical protein VTO42DRAFT_5692 [Malbranchea cinnamomea]
MILQRVLRPQTGLRAASLCRSPLRAPIQARKVHNVPQLAYGKIFSEQGIPDVMSPEGYDMAWTQYQSFLIHKLNLLTNGTRDEDVPTGSLIVKYARDPNMASLFNYASMAHNNHFFFSCISPTPVPVPPKLEEAISESCSSMESLKADFLATANAMFGPGFVWLVKEKSSGQLKILTTYIAGSPYPAAHFRRQAVDMATQPGFGIDSGDAYKTASRTYGFMGKHSGQTRLAPGAADVHPILCVNTWQHVWLRDWGIAGKDGFLEAWWDKINWEEVAQNFSQIGPDRIATNKSGVRSIAF